MSYLRPVRPLHVLESLRAVLVNVSHGYSYELDATSQPLGVSAGIDCRRRGTAVPDGGRSEAAKMSGDAPPIRQGTHPGGCLALGWKASAFAVLNYSFRLACAKEA